MANPESGTDERIEAGDLAHMATDRLVAALEGPWLDHLTGKTLPAQLPRAALRGMSPGAIVKARRLGLLNEVQGKG